MYESVNRVLSWYQSYDLAGRARHWAENRDRGASAVEYGLILFAIAAAVVVFISLIGDRISAVWRQSCINITGKAC
jgi:Flp pilus assembly pilin Flp